MPVRRPENQKDHLFESVADKLLSYIENSGIKELPPIRVLAPQFSVGEYSITKAIEILEAKGTLSRSRGRQARIVTTGGLAADDALLSKNAQKLLLALRQEILSGKRHTSTPLPKMEFLEAQLHISLRNIIRVFRQLAQERLVHKEGKKWIVGPEAKNLYMDEDSETILNKDSPAILALDYTVERWTKSLQSRSEWRFVQTFCDEIEKYHVRLIPCGIENQETNVHSHCGFEKVRELVHSLGPHYVGTIVRGGPFPQQFGVSTHDWLNMFAKTKKPLVWCDIDGGEYFQLPDDIASDLKFCSVQYDEVSMARIAITSLAKLGHKKVGVPFAFGKAAQDPHWSLYRMALLSHTAVHLGLDIRIVPVEVDGDYWDFGTEASEWDGPEIITDKMRDWIAGQPKESAEAGKRKNSTRGDLLAAAPFLARLIRDEGITAIIAPNDCIATQIYGWMTLVGLDIPNEISMVSFDNEPFMRSYPLATIDRGQSHMAYCAAHLIINDIPIQVDSKSVALSKPMLIDRGSLAPPRKKRITL